MSDEDDSMLVTPAVALWDTAATNPRSGAQIAELEAKLEESGAQAGEHEPIARDFTAAESRLWKDAIGEATMCDCALVSAVDGDRLPAHRAVIASQSGAVAALLDGEKPAPGAGISLLDRTSILVEGICTEALHVVLQSMYTGVAVPGRFARFAGQIQRAAKLLGVPEPVIAMHEDRASPPQRAGDAVGHLTDCERASDLVLARAAFEAAIEESPLIFATREFMELSPSILAALLADPQLKADSEIDVLDACLCWARRRLGFQPLDRDRLMRRVASQLDKHACALLLPFVDEDELEAAESSSPDAAAATASAASAASAAGAAAASGAGRPGDGSDDGDDGGDDVGRRRVRALKGTPGLLFRALLAFRDSSTAPVGLGREAAKSSKGYVFLRRLMSGPVGARMADFEAFAHLTEGCPTGAELRETLWPDIMPLLRLGSLSVEEMVREVISLGVLSATEAVQVMAAGLNGTAGPSTLFRADPRPRPDPHTSRGKMTSSDATEQELEAAEAIWGELSKDGPFLEDHATRLALARQLKALSPAQLVAAMGAVRCVWTPKGFTPQIRRLGSFKTGCLSGDGKQPVSLTLQSALALRCAAENRLVELSSFRAMVGPEDVFAAAAAAAPKHGALPRSEVIRRTRGVVRSLACFAIMRML